MGKTLSINVLHWPRYLFSAVVFAMGFILSPFTWWNDLVVNLPIAWFLTSFFPHAWFKPAFIVSYWVTNIAGLMMMYFSKDIITHKKIEPLSRNTFAKLLLITTLFTLIFWLLMVVRIIRPIDFTPFMKIVP